MKYGGFKSWQKELVSSNIFLYKIWFYGIRQWRGGPARLPSTSDDWYFDGYPRSGNTFFTGLFKKLISQKKFAHHLHSIAGLKIALKLQLPVFIIIRDPKDAVVSNLFREVTAKNQSPDKKLIEKLLISYHNYYTFVNSNLRDLNLLNFETCVENELLTVKKVAEKAGFKIDSDEILQQNMQNYKIMMKKKEDEKDSYASSLPNDQREKFKKDYLTKVLNSPSYNMAKITHDKLIKHDLLCGDLIKSA